MTTPSQSRDGVDVSIVVPVFGCEPCLRELHRRLTHALASLSRSYELLFIDDRSPDGAWKTICDLSTEDHAVRALRMTRNFGQQAAITAGLAHAIGYWTVVMDCDLQDPPELVPELLAKASEGYDVVLTRRLGQHRSSSIRRLGATLYFRIVSRLLRASVDPTQGAFSVLSAPARHAFLTITDRDRHYIPIVHWIGFDQGYVDYEPAARPVGRSSYTVAKLIQLAVEGVFFQTTTLLRYVIYTGFGVCIVGFALALYDLYARIFLHPPGGFTSLSVLLLVLAGFIIISTGVAGLYIGQIFQQVKGRPLYLVDAEIADGAVVRCHEKRATPARAISPHE